MVKFTNIDSLERYIIEKSFNFYRQTGFPCPNFNEVEMLSEFYKLCLYRLTPKYQQGKKILPISNIGLDVANYFHQEIWECKGYNMLSPLEAYSNDKLLKKAIKLALHTTKKISSTSVLNKLKIVSGTQSCSNFRPTIAKFIYEYANLKQDSIVIDPCCGYGGRLLAFLAYLVQSSIVATYIGIDPNCKVIYSNEDMATFFGFEKCVELFCVPFEEIDLTKYNSSVDLVFTSPPYFKKEIYCDSHTQSSIRYPEYSVWVDSFLAKLISKAYDLLKSNGLFVINIADVNIKGQRYSLTSDFLKIANRVGFVLKDTFRMQFSGFGSNLSKTKYEPIFVMAKSR